MPTKTYQNRDRHLDTKGKLVGFYERDFYCFSNFSSFAVRWKGRLWPTSEHAYQASKFMKTAPALSRRIECAPSAHEAFKLAMANRGKHPADWDERKFDVMLDILRHKVRQHPYVAYKLKLTGRRTLVEDSFRDPVWGWGKNRKGRNMLGKLWMQVRAELSTGMPK
jgi:ribA/ribD-fused uncharacterized protein